MPTNRTRHLMTVCSMVMVGLAATSGAASAPTLPGNLEIAAATPSGGAITSLALDPRNPRIIYAGTSKAGVFKSLNGGKTWQERSALSGGVLALAVHPTRPGVVYAAMGRRGVFRTSDGGQRWQAMNVGLRSSRVAVLEVARAQPEVVYAGTSEGIFKSTDGGQRWHEAWRGVGHDVRDVAVDPTNPRIIYATTYGWVLKSSDGARTWRTVWNRTLGGPAGVYGRDLPIIAIHPRTPKTMYVGANGVGRTSDGGRSWVGELREHRITAFAFDPLTPDTVFAASYQGVYQRAADGTGWEAIGRRVRYFSLAIDPQGTKLYAGTGRGVVTYKLRQ